VTHAPQIEALDYMIDVNYAEVGVRLVHGLPNRYSAMPELTYRPTRLLDEHNEDVFCGLLGLSSQQFNELVVDCTIYRAAHPDTRLMLGRPRTPVRGARQLPRVHQPHRGRS
jgi:hypothetical protein